MPDEYLFISDCHLDAGRPDVSNALIHFINTRASQARHLYILGDLFEVWIGDDDPAEDHQAVIACLRAVAKHTEVFFMAGNRDFLLGNDFAKSVGLSLLVEPQLLRLGNQLVVLIHGDSLCTDDHDYQNFRKRVRAVRWQSEFLRKPLSERQRIATQLRSDSIEAMAQKSFEIMDVNSEAVAECFRQNRVNTIIHGHTHRPAIHRYPAKLTRYVLGDWNPDPSFLSWSPGTGFELVDARVNSN